MGNSAIIFDNGTAQNISLGNSNNLSVVASAASAGISAQGGQTISLSGTGTNAIAVGAGFGRNLTISGSNQNISAGMINVFGGTVDGKQSTIHNNIGSQMISASGAITLTGGTA